jgi:predicted nucleic acid-binding protein
VILLDTNVISETTRTVPDPVLRDWLNRQAPVDLWTTSITVFEVRFGIARMPEGEKRRALATLTDKVFGDVLAGRISDFDTASAEAAARLAADRQAKGRSIDIRDTMIAGIALARRAAIATRNVRHFADLDILVIDPWSPAGSGR